MKIPFIQRVTNVFLRNWLLKTLVKALVSAGKRGGLPWFCWRLMMSCIRHKGRTEKYRRCSGADLDGSQPVCSSLV